MTDFNFTVLETSAAIILVALLLSHIVYLIRYRPLEASLKDHVNADNCNPVPAPEVESFNLNPHRMLRAGNPLNLGSFPAQVSDLPDMDRITEPEDRHHPRMRAPVMSPRTSPMRGTTTGRWSSRQSNIVEQDIIQPVILYHALNSYGAQIDTAEAPHAVQSPVEVHCPSSPHSTSSYGDSSSSCGLTPSYRGER